MDDATLLAAQLIPKITIVYLSDVLHFIHLHNKVLSTNWQMRRPQTKEFSLFRRSELVYLTNRQSGISKATREVIRAYCENNKISLDRHSISREEWYNELRRLDLKLIAEEIHLSKKLSAKRFDFFTYIFAIVGITSIIIFMVDETSKASIQNPLPYSYLFACIFLGFMLFNLVRRLKTKRNDLKSQLKLIIIKNNVTYELENRLKVQDSAIKSIHYYWEDTSDTGPGPITLEIKLNNHKIVRIDQDGNYKELFEVADKISELTGVKFDVIHGPAHMSKHIKL